MKKVLLKILYFFAAGLVLFFIASGLENKPEEEPEPEADIAAEEEPSFSSEPDYTNFTNIAFDAASVSVSGTGVMVNGTAVTIAFPGTYRLSGVSDNASVTVNCEYDGSVFLWLDGLSLTCESGPALYIADAIETTVLLAEGSENYLADAAYTIADNAETARYGAALLSRDNLTVTGGGRLTVAGFYKNGLQCNDSLSLNGADIVITAINDAVKANDAITVTGATLQLLSSGDGIQCDDGDIFLSESTVIIASEEDGISAAGEVALTDSVLTVGTHGGAENYAVIEAEGVSAKGIRADKLSVYNCRLDFDCADDALHAADTCLLTQGVYALRSGNNAIYAGTSLEAEALSLDIPTSYDGLQAPQITLQGGSVTIAAEDDALQASRGDLLQGVSAGECFVKITDGYVSLCSASGIASDGDILLLGGEVYIQVLSAETAALQWGSRLVLEGCELFGTGLFSAAEPAEENLSQCVLAWSFAEEKPAETVFTLTDAVGSEMFTAAPEQAYSSVFYSSPMLETEGVYTLSAAEESANIQLLSLYTQGSGVPVAAAQQESSSGSKKDGGMPGMR